MKTIAVILVLSCLSLCFARSVDDGEPTQVWGDVSGDNIHLTEIKTLYEYCEPNAVQFRVIDFPTVCNNINFLIDDSTHFNDFSISTNRIGDNEEFGNCWRQIFRSRCSSGNSDFIATNSPATTSSFFGSIRSGTRS